jgi:hypothetical protein
MKTVIKTFSCVCRIAVWLDSTSPFYGVYEKEGGLAQLRGEIAKPTLE